MWTGILSRWDELKRVSISKSKPSNAAGPALSLIAAHGNRPYLSTIGEIAKLRLGVGKLSRDEYLQLALFDDKIYGDCDKKAFVGIKVAPKIWLQANYRVDLFALVNNKVASDIWFVTHGLPILPTVALFHEKVGRPSPFLLRSEAELRVFLRKIENYPLFGKPVYGFQSVGSASIENYDPAQDHLVTTAGYAISVDNFVSYVRTHAASGYQFQPRVDPHADVRALCGNRLATVRLLTAVTSGKVEILRGCWKIPAGVNIADNFWRPGNLLAELDLENGRVKRVIRKSGTFHQEITHHPDTGSRITDTFIPNWEDVTRLAVDGALLLQELPLVGWDIAPVDSGAVLVEPNVTPDFQLHQLADRRGILDPAFKNFLRRRNMDKAEYRRAKPLGRPAAH